MLTVSERGFGKRSSSYDYRISGRGGKGITAMIVNDRNGRAGGLVPGRGERPDHAGHERRQADPLPVDDVRIAARNTQGVRIFKTEEDEKVVSVERIPEDGNGGADNGNGGRRQRRRRARLRRTPIADSVLRRAQVASGAIRLTPIAPYFAVFILSKEKTKSCLSSGLWQVKQALRLALSLTVLSVLKA